MFDCAVHYAVPIVNEIYKRKGLFIYFTIFTLITSICFDQYVQYLQGHEGALQLLERMRFVIRPSYLICFLLVALLRDWGMSKNIFTKQKKTAYSLKKRYINKLLYGNMHLQERKCGLYKM